MGKRQIHINRKTVLSDLIAGLTNALVYIPQGLAYGLVAGVSPIYGIYTGLVAPVVGALTGGPSLMVVIATNELAMSVEGVKNGVALFDLHGADVAGSTGLAFIERYVKKLAAGNSKLMLYGVEPRMMKELEATGTIKVIGRENVISSTTVLGESLENALAAAKEWIDQNKK